MKLDPIPLKKAHLLALLKGLFVTFLWAVAWILIKVGLSDVPPVTFAGLRIFLAFLLLAAWYFSRFGFKVIRSITVLSWSRLALLGIVYYAITHAVHYISLSYLPAVTVNLLFRLSPILVALLSIMIPAERLVRSQWLGMIVALGGVLLYFSPFGFAGESITGVIFAGIGVVGTAVSILLGRYVNMNTSLTAMEVTLFSMGFGGVLLLSAGIWLEGIPVLSWQNWGIIAFLAFFSTALAFTIWNNVMRVLTAIELSMLMTTLLVQIAILAVLFLGETLTITQVLAMILVGSGVLIVQFGRFIHAIDFFHPFSHAGNKNAGQ